MKLTNIPNIGQNIDALAKATVQVRNDFETYLNKHTGRPSDVPPEFHKFASQLVMLGGVVLSLRQMLAQAERT